MASGRRPTRRMTENDRELVNGALGLAGVVMLLIVVYYWAY